MLSIDTIIAEREVSFEPQESGRSSSSVRFRLGRPVRGESDWYCPFEVSGLGADRVDAAHGADSLQALLLALAKLRVVLGALALEHRGRIAFAGQLGPGLPSLFEEAEPFALEGALEASPEETSSES